MNKTIENKIPGISIAFGIIIITEIMFFGGLISAYIIASAKAMTWPPLDQPRLPQYITLPNILILLLSGVFYYLFEKKSKSGIWKKQSIWTSIALSLVFLFIQGSEWINLINFGIQSSSGLYASYFYSLIALHGIHVMVGISLLIILMVKINKNKKNQNLMDTTVAFGMFWYFVVLLWPILYFLLYML